MYDIQCVNIITAVNKIRNLIDKLKLISFSTPALGLPQTKDVDALMSEIFDDIDDLFDTSEEEEHLDNNLKRKHANSPEKPNKQTVVNNGKFIVITHDIK